MRNKILYLLILVAVLVSITGMAHAYTITATTSPGGTTDPAGVIDVAEGATQTIYINPSAGYHVVDVLVDGVSVGAAVLYTFNTVAADHTIAASFAATIYTITATTSPGGIISPNGAQRYYDNDQLFTATPDAGYQVASMLVNGVSTGPSNSYEFNKIRSNQTISGNH